LNSIYVVVTHHPGCRRHTKEDAAEAWKQDKVCAIGWHGWGDLRKVPKNKLLGDMKHFLGIRRGDIILAYTRSNIACVGDVLTRDSYVERNRVGRPEKEGGFGYPNQCKVNWWSTPTDVLPSQLPGDLATQMGKRGRSVIPLKLGRRTLEQVREILRNTPSGSGSHNLDEDTIKAGIAKYLRRDLGNLEPGMRILKAEKSISKSERPDFIGVDATERSVVIECKGWADINSLRQLADRYRRWAPTDARLLLVAYRFDDECRKEAKRYRNVELWEADLGFTKIA
jgi:hypothetical protein